MARTHSMTRRAALALLGTSAAAASSLAACAPLRGNGMVVERDVALARDVRSVDVGDGIEATFYLGERQSVLLRGEANLLAELEVSVDARGNLRVETRGSGGIAPMVPVRLLVSCARIDAVTARGGAQVEVLNAPAGNFTVDASEGARVTLAGPELPDASASTDYAGEIGLTLRGGSEADLSMRAASTVRVDAEGGSRARVWATSQVTGTLRAGSRLSVKGAARVSVTSEGGSSIERE